MRKRFVAINHDRKRFLLLGMIIFVFVLAFIITIKLILWGIKSILISDEEQVNMLNYGVSNVKVVDLNLLNPSDILTVSLNIKKDNANKLEIISRDDDNPLVYIYNTHDKETNVTYASGVLRDELLKYGIPSLVEDKSVSEYLTINGLSKNDAFVVSRTFIDEAWRENETLKYFIDIHSSSASSDVTSVNIDGNDYAKVLYVVSMESKFYESTLEFADILNSMLDKRLSRGVMKKSDVSNYYNQDMDAKCLTIELGGSESSREEIDNTIKIFGEILYQYMSEGYDGN